MIRVIIFYCVGILLWMDSSLGLSVQGKVKLWYFTLDGCIGWRENRHSSCH